MKEEPTQPSQNAESIRLTERCPAESRRSIADNLSNAERRVHQLQVHEMELEMQNGELRLARNLMEAGLEKYSDLYDFAPVAYLTLDREGKIREMNVTATALFGMERNQLLGRNLAISLIATDRPVLTAFLDRTFRSRVRDFCDVTLLRPGMPATPVRIEAAATASGLECRATLTDITQSRLAERDRSMQDKLEAAGSLAAGLAQDYGDLLGKILLNLELAQTLTPPKEAFLARHIEAAAHATVVAQELTQHMAALSPKTTVPVRTPVALPEVLQACSKSILDGHPVQCLFLIPKNLWKVEVDLSHLGQVLHHVILNAREAMPHGGTMTIQAENHTLHTTEVHALAPGDYVRLSISDRGGGMTEAIQPRIFDPYFTTKVRDNHWGRGLGLTICRAVIRKNGGTIEVESQEGVGTTFHIDLPAVRQRAIPGSVQSRSRRGKFPDEPPGSSNAPLQEPSPT